MNLQIASRAVAVLALTTIYCAELMAAARPTWGAPAEVGGWRAVTVAEGISHPWGIDWLPDGRALVTARGGTLHVLKGNRFELVPLEGLPAPFTQGQGGLLDISVRVPRGASPRIYLTMATGTEQANRTILVRGVFQNDRVTGIKTLFRVQPDKTGTEHFGSRLTWLGDGTLLMSIGDGGNPPRRLGGALSREQAQNKRTHLGKVLRLTPEGRPAFGNPFTKTPGAATEIWALGVRNIQGMTRDTQTGRVWATEHGPRGGDELNLIRGGLNYGWPLQSYGADYRTGEAVGRREVPGMVIPLAAWVPSPAPSGLAYYTGSHFPAWRGSLFSGGLVSKDLRRVVLDARNSAVRQERLTIGSRVRDVRQGPDGYLYVLTDEKNGQLLRIEPTP